MKLDNHKENLSIIVELKDVVVHLLNDNVNGDCYCEKICQNVGGILLSVIESLNLLGKALNTIKDIKDIQERYKAKRLNNEKLN